MSPKPHPEPLAEVPAAYDVAISGGGLIGGCLAGALAGCGLKVALIEAVAPQSQSQPSYDERVIALSWGSRLILEAIGLWAGMAGEAAPIERVHISDRGRFGFSHLDRRGLGVEALGYVVPARAMGSAIRTALEGRPDLDVLCPARLAGQRVGDSGVLLSIAAEGAERTVSARLLVAADGGGSAVRRGLAIETEERGYGQDAVIATVAPERPQPGTAFERFTDTGPLALLPMTQGRYSVVWTCLESQTAEILALSDRAFVDRLQGRFGWRLGRLALPSPRRAYPLKLVLPREPVRPRLVLIGNAAHTLHPVAGQGFNLGLRDVAALAEVLAEGAAIGRDPGSPEGLAAYRAWRDLLPMARRALARRFMGIDGRLPRLALGLPLAAAAPRPSIELGPESGSETGSGSGPAPGRKPRRQPRQDQP
jgi:2-octaprenyl-6-methoxyphenol hydroxylase